MNALPAIVAFVTFAAATDTPTAGLAQDARTVAGSPVPATPPRDTLWASVTYLSGASVYVNAGSGTGLGEGSRLDVVRGGAVVAELVVAFVSSTRASCTVSRSTADPAVGDSVRYVVARHSPAVVAAPGGSGVASPPTAPGAAGHLRGRVGMRYLTVSPAGGGGPGVSQPALDLRLDGQHLGGTPLGVVVDVRAQRSVISSAGAATSSSADTRTVTRAYQASLTWNPPGSATHITMGRQPAAAVPTLGFLDGVAVDLNGRHVDAGVLAGLQPEPMQLGMSSDITEYGAYVQAHNGPGFGNPWSLSAAAVGTYDHGQINREFGYFRGVWNTRWLSFYGSQEVDLNRGWRAEKVGASATATSTFVIVQVSPAGWLSFNGGFDNRSNVWLYRDYVNPLTAFDDAFHEGHWGGVTVMPERHVRLSADARVSLGGGNGTTESNTYTASVTNLTQARAGLRLRSTIFTGDFTAGRLESATAELEPFAGVFLSATAGRRLAATGVAAGAATDVQWTSLDGDVGIGPSVYLTLSVSRETGASGGSTQTYVALSYRF